MIGTGKVYPRDKIWSMMTRFVIDDDDLVVPTVKMESSRKQRGYHGQGREADGSSLSIVMKGRRSLDKSPLGIVMGKRSKGFDKSVLGIVQGRRRVVDKSSLGIVMGGRETSGRR